MTIEQKTKLEETFTIAHKQYNTALNRHAFFKLNNSDLSADLVQNTFIKTWNYLMKGGEIHIMKAFLYHVLNNLIIDQYRKHKTNSLDLLIEKGFEPNTNDFRRIFDILDGEKAFLLIKKIPEKYQKIINMRFVQDMSIEEISANIGTSRNNIAVQIHRGLEKLKLLYKNLNSC